MKASKYIILELLVIGLVMPMHGFSQPMPAYLPPPLLNLGEAPPMPKTLSVLPPHVKPRYQTVTGGFSVDNDSREQVRDFYNAIYPTSENIPILSTGDVTNCFPGTNSPSFMEGVLRRINWFRAMAGEPASVVFNDTYNSNAQAVAVMISSSGLLNHDPPTNWPCYSAAGAAGAGGNQAGGWDGADAITGYIWDFGNGNNEVGHRRWILFPSEQIMGTGDLPMSGTNIAANSTYVFDSSINDPRPPTRQPYVSWPPEGYVPYQLAYPYWSFAISNADFTNATVAMYSNGSPVSVAIQPYVTGYGENTIVWVPDGLDANCECTTFPFNGTDTVYTVNVGNIVLQGGATTNYSYNVTLFDPSVPGTDYVATTISGPLSPTVGGNNSYSCVPLANTNTTGYQWLIGQLANGNVVEDANADSTNESLNLTNGQLVNFTYAPLPEGCPIITNSPTDTNMCFHLCHFVVTPQLLTLNELLYPTTNTSLSFESFLGYATTNEVATVEASTDGGNTWQELYSELGVASGEADSSFTLKTVSLAGFAGQQTLLRFNYNFVYNSDGSYSFYNLDYNFVGWCLENVQITNALQVVSTTTNNTTSTNFTFKPSQAGEYALYAEPVLFTQFPVAYGPAYPVTAVTPAGITMNTPVVTNNTVELNFTIAGGLTGTYQLLQTTNAKSAWTTNMSATFTTNTPGTSYRFTTTKNAEAEYYQVKLAP